MIPHMTGEVDGCGAEASLPKEGPWRRRLPGLPASE